MLFNEKLIQRRKERGLTQEDLAAAISGIVDSIAPRGLLSKENQPHGIRSNRTKRRFADSFSGIVDYIVD